MRRPGATEFRQRRARAALRACHVAPPRTPRASRQGRAGRLGTAAHFYIALVQQGRGAGEEPLGTNKELAKSLHRVGQEPLGIEQAAPDASAQDPSQEGAAGFLECAPHDWVEPCFPRAVRHSAVGLQRVMFSGSSILRLIDLCITQE